MEKNENQKHDEIEKIKNKDIEKDKKSRRSRKKPQKDQKQQKESKKNKINGWMIAFFVLLGILVGSVAVVTTRIYTTREEIPQEKIRKKNEQLPESPTFQMQLNKSQANQVIDYYMQEFIKDSGVKYKFYLENEALLNGNFKLLGHDTKFYLYFDPFVLEDGNVLLKAKSLSIGTLSLPIPTVMNYIKSHYKLPDWVEIKSKNKTVMLHLDKFTLQNGMSIRAKEINLVEDNIRFGVYLPKANK